MISIFPRAPILRIELRPGEFSEESAVGVRPRSVVVMQRPRCRVRWSSGLPGKPPKGGAPALAKSMGGTTLSEIQAKGRPMKRLFLTFSLLLAATCSSVLGQELSSPKTSAKPVSLAITDTGQEKRRPESGWCGEAAIQMALAYYGGYASQQAINRAGKPEHPDLYEQEIPTAIRNVGLEVFALERRRPGGLLEVDTKRACRRPPRFRRGEDLSHRASRVALDHFMLAVGCTEDALTYNTTWGRPQTKTFAQLSTQDRGIAFANRFDTYCGHAITGMRIKPAQVDRSLRGSRSAASARRKSSCE